MADLTADKAVSAPPASRLRRRPRRWLRPMLIALGPLALLCGGAYVYLTGGRYISTDNAYVRADLTRVSTDVSGRVAEILVHENEKVTAGQVLFRLDDATYRYAVERAQAQLAMTRLDIDAMRATYAQKQADLKAAQDTLDWQTRELERQQQLMASHVTSQQAYDQARHNADAARQNVDATRQALANILASLAGNPKIETDQHPRVMGAKAQLDQAELDLAHTIIRAPAHATVAQIDKLQTGEYVTAGTPLFALIGRKMWVEANFKETDLTHMQPGQSATIDVDTFSGQSCAGRVIGISPGTGSEFSVLPPQNATGNWVKIVQRVPVRIAVGDCTEDLSLRSGMSATVEVDTQHRRPIATLVDGVLAAIPGRAASAGSK